MWFILLIIICTVISIKTETHSELLICILLIILWGIIQKQPEFFYNSPEGNFNASGGDTEPSNFDKLYQIPVYMERVVGEGIDKLIQASVPDTHDNSEEMTYITPELFLDDPDFHAADGTVDTERYNLMIGEYNQIDKVLQAIRKNYSKAYKQIIQ